jgi:carbonic anhydrase
VWGQQSPIDLREPTYHVAGLSRLVEFHYSGTVRGELNGETHEIELRDGSNAHVLFDGVRCELLKLHFHMGSEHRVGGAQRFMEVHLVHAIPSEEGMGSKLLVVGVFLDAGAPDDGSGASKFEFLPQVFAATSAGGGEAEGEAIEFAPEDLLPGDTGKFWHYEGSLTTPDFEEVVSWVVLRDSVKLGGVSEELSKHTTKSARAAQPLGRRFVLRSFEATGEGQ